MKYSSDVAFSPSVKRIQTERGSRVAYARVEQAGGFETEITDELKAFLRQIDTAFLATASADGQPYVQHRGGTKGFIRPLDEHTLAFLDFSGNRQYVSAGNLAENDRVCLFLIDYARRRRVKVWGTAQIVPLTDDLRARLTDPSDRSRPEHVVTISVTAWDINCPQHIPHKLDGEDVARALHAYEARIAELEADNARLAAAAGSLQRTRSELKGEADGHDPGSGSDGGAESAPGGASASDVRRAQEQARAVPRRGA